MARLMRRVEKLQRILGEYHDGVVVEVRLWQAAPLTSSARRVLALLNKRKKCLRQRAGKFAWKLERAV